MSFQADKQQHTTSIVDISELEEEDLAATNAAPNGRPGAGAQLYLFHEDVAPHQRVPSLLSQLSGVPAPDASASPASTLARNPLPAIDYRPASQAGAELGGPRSDTPAAGGDPNKANLGTLSGVYFPCVQNIFGVILFIRMVWIVGTAGVPAAFSLVFICCCVTFTTSISLSAIATNGIVPAGGSYFMISRSLGPECGGAVGTMFFLGTTVAGAMYITGAVEIMLNYLAPSWGLFGDFQRDVSIMYNNIRVYGTALLLLVGLLVWIGVRFVSKLAPIALFCVLLSIFSIYTGILVNFNGRQDLWICVLGDRLVTLKNLPYDEPAFGLNSDQSSPQDVANKTALAEYELRKTKALCTADKLKLIYCPSTSAGASNDDQYSATSWLQASKAPNMSNCDPYFMANRHRVHLERAVPGKS